MGEYDVPANINFILGHTHQKKIHYVGHSQGTTQFFVANALNNISERIATFSAIGPVMYVSNIYSPAVKILRDIHLDTALIDLQFYNLLVIPNPISVILREFVNKFRNTMWRFIEMACGMSKVIHTDLSLMPTLVRNEPGGTSIFNGKHWLDNFRKGDFYRFDYGNDADNLKKYGTT